MFAYGEVDYENVRLEGGEKWPPVKESAQFYLQYFWGNRYIRYFFPFFSNALWCVARS